MKQWQNALQLANLAPRCKAKTRSNTRCQSPAMPNGRCRMHGGSSPGAPCGVRHGRHKHGLYTNQAKAQNTYVIQLIKAARALEQEVT